jgi:hypothetical protein
LGAQVAEAAVRLLWTLLCATDMRADAHRSLCAAACSARLHQPLLALLRGAQHQQPTTSKVGQGKPWLMSCSDIRYGRLLVDI